MWRLLRVLMLALLGLIFWGGVEATAGKPLQVVGGNLGHGETGGVMWSVEAAQMDKAFRGGESPILLEPKGFLRLGMRWDAPASVRWEARFRYGNAPWGAWHAVSVTWREELSAGIMAHNGLLDPPEGKVEAVQIRYLGGQPRFVVVDLIRRIGEAPPSSHVTYSLPFPGQALTGPFNPRSAWGAAAPKCTSADPTKTRIAVHHTVTPNNETGNTILTRLRGIQSYHQNTQGWCDIGYHLLISWDGQAWEGRPAELLGTHVGGQNTGALGISFMGDFTSVEPPAVMTCTGSKLIDWGVKTFNVPRNRTSIMGHREFPGQSTACPGARLLPLVTTMVQQSSTGNCVAPPPPRCDYVRVARATTLNIRSQPNTNQAPIGTVNEGTCLRVLSKTDTGQAVSGNTTWYQITHNNITGWISAYYADCADCGPPIEPKGTIKGIVYDAEKADRSLPIQGAIVRLNTGENATTDASGAYSISVKPGAYTITASKAGYQNAQKQATVEDGKEADGHIALTKSVEEDKTPPQIAITQPTDGATLPAGALLIQGTASDDKKLDRVEVNGKLANLAADGTFRAEVSLPAGTQKITATAFDAAGNQASAEITLTLTEEATETTPEEEATEIVVDAAPDNAQPTEREERLILEAPPEIPQSENGQALPCKMNSDCSTDQLCQNGRCTPLQGVSGGCNCQSAQPPFAFFLALFSLLLLFARRRRRL